MFDQTAYECPVCLEYYKDPKVLSCGHSVCGECVRKLTLTCATREKVNCPECKRITWIPHTGLPTNYPLSGLTEKFKQFEMSELKCDFCKGHKISVCEACVGNSFQVLRGTTSALDGRWKYDSQTNINHFLKSLGMGLFRRWVQKLRFSRTFTLLELSGSKWMLSVRRWFSHERMMLEMNKTINLGVNRQGTTFSEIVRYNAAEDCLERIVHEAEIEAEEKSISYSTSTGVQAVRIYKRLPLDLDAL